MKRLLLFSICMILSRIVAAQSDFLCPQSSVPTFTINSCTGPTPYTIPTSFVYEDTANVTRGTTCVTASNVIRDGWIKFTAISTTTAIIGTVNAQDLALIAYSGTCGSATMNEIGCINQFGNGGTEILTIPTVIGTDYFIRIVKNATSPGNMAGTISILTPITNDDCSGAISLTPSAPGGSCTQTCGRTYNATGSSPATPCGGVASADVWFKFTAIQMWHTITVQGSSLFNASVELLSGNCGSLLSLGCANITADGGIESLTHIGLIAGNTYFIRVYDFNPIVPTTYEFNICVTSPIMPTCPTNLGNGVVNVASLPYNGTGLTTTGMGDDFTVTNTQTCGSSSYLQGLDNVYIFTPNASGSISVTLTSGSANVGIMLYDNCPFAGSGANCVAFSQSSSGNQFFCTNVVSGTKYYLIVDRANAGGTVTNYSLTITAPATGNTGNTCASAVPISSLPYSISNQTTLCKGDDYTNASSVSCGSLYESGEDMVFSYTSSGAQCLQIALSNTSATQAGFSVYQGCPSSSGSACLGNIGGGNVSTNITLPAAGTYYIIVDSWAPPSNITFNLDITTTPGASPNDYPCSATTLPLGSTLTGDNRCSNGLLEPAVPSCWTAGNVNTVWYKVTPSGTTLNISTILGTLTNTQIALYKGSCSSLTQVTPTGTSCNTDVTNCSGVVTLNSQMIVTGLSSGTPYYIRVDGEQDLTGTFQITAIDGNAGPSLIPGQDCGSPFTVCQNNVVSTSYNGNGNYCDFTAVATGNCITSGEINSVWYTIPISSSGTLMFDIIPNDWPGSGTSGSDYDFAIWEVGQSGLACSQLTNTAPTRCNNDVLGVTGLFTGGNAPAGYPGFNNAYETGIAVTAGQVYKLVISNNSGSSSGFTLNFTSSPDPITYPSPPATMTWTGAVNSNWSLGTNWGQCTIPSCAINATCAAGPNQPVLSSNQTVKDLVINAGATLTINPGIVLSVCGNFTNNGNLVTGAGSIVRFIGSGAQFMAGSLTGANAFTNLTMAKTGGTLTMQANVDIRENDSLLTGLLNTNSKYIRVKKNFYNANGTVTHVSPATGSTYEFNGNAPQVWTNIGAEINLNNVIMNQSPATSMTLTGGTFNNLNVNGVLTLTSGKIITNAFEVVVKNPANAAVTGYSVNSYVEGYLRRYLNTNATGLYDFPVGHAAKGYQMASINFTIATQIPQLLAYFTPWGALPVGPVSNECTFVNYSLSPALDNGFWTIEASANPNTGTYNMTLNNRNYTNALNGWTIMKRSPAGSGPWALSGTCVVTSLATATKRNGMTGFSDFATAQSAVPLPIELLKFEAVAKHGNVLTTWETASETNNDYFVVERSNDLEKFTNVGTVDGAGTSTEHHSYELTDSDPGAGIFYYRLKQFDFDGGYSYSEIVAVKITEVMNEINIYPNPANSTIYFDFESPFESPVKLQLVDIFGKVLKEEIRLASKGIVNYSMEIKSIPEGVYTLQVVETDDVYKGKFIKIRD